MDVVGRRKSSGPKIGAVMAGSVWESRMKLDEFKGGIKVFNADQDCSCSSNNNSNNDDVLDDNDDGGGNDLSGGGGDIVPVVVQMDKKAILKTKQSTPVSSPSPTGGGKRKTWKSDILEGSPFRIARQRSEMSKVVDLDEQCKEELNVSGGNGIVKKSPFLKKTRSELFKEDSSVSIVDKKKLTNQTMKLRSSSSSSSSSSSIGGNNDGVEKNSVQFLRKAKSQSVSDDSLQLVVVKAKSESSKDFDEECSNGIQHNSIIKQKKKLLGDDDDDDEGIGNDCKVFDICQDEKVITNNAVVLYEKKTATKEGIDEFEEGIDDEIEKKSLVVKEIIADQKAKKIVVEEDKKKVLESNETPLIVLKKQQSSPPLPSLLTKVHPIPTKTKSIPVSHGYQRIPRTHSKLQSFVDLVMWKDVSKSAFVFGIGTFFIISSSYTKDLNISLISVLSYLGLAYLAAIFLFRSFISRGSIDLDDSSMDSVIGEEEAIWLIKLFLPYLNEFLLKLKALFSGDPSTTMKMSLVLFVLARCGISITIWKMAKLSFFGVFTVPKICSSYSPQLTAMGTFWIRRFRDAWDSCSHKKAVAFAIFTLVWNLSSFIARIWAVFMLFVAFRYYKNSMIREGWVKEEKEDEVVTVDASSPHQAQNKGPAQIPTRRPITLDTAKPKKAF